MGQALLNGFERGFNMMERHQARVGRDERLSRIEDQNESRYQDKQVRLADMDERNESRYQDGQTRQKNNDANTALYRESMLNESEKRTENQSKQYLWKQNQAEEQKQWGLIAPQMQNIHQQYFETGEVPEQAAKFFEENPQYNDYNPDSYKNPEYRKSVKMLRDKTTEIFKGKKLHEFKDPEYIKLFDQAFQSKIKQGIGEVDLPRNARIVDKTVAQLVPTREGRVSIGLEVTYQTADGKTYTEIQPMTKGRTGDKEDPVNEWDLKELLTAIETRSTMADMAENGEHYLNRSKNTIGAMGFGQVKDEKGYRKALSSLDKDLTNAITKVQGDSNFAGMPDEKKAAIKQIKQTFKQRKSSLDQSYGIKSEETPEPVGKAGTVKYKSTIDGQDVNGVIERFMGANKGMTKEQAIAAATNQGYLTNDE